MRRLKPLLGRRRALGLATLTVVVFCVGAGAAYATSWYTWLNRVNEPYLHNSYSGQACIYEVGAEAASVGYGGANQYDVNNGFEYGSFYTAPHGTPVYTPFNVEGARCYNKGVSWNDSYSTQQMYGQFEYNSEIGT